MRNSVVLTVVHARWVVPIIPKDAFYENYSLVLDGRKIKDLLPTSEAKLKYTGVKEIDLSEEHVLMPGLINLHCHTPMSLLRGFADDVPLMEWLIHYMWPAEGRWVSENFIEVGTTLSCIEMLKCGVTCVNDMYFFPDTIAQVFERIGMRGTIGAPLLMFPTAWAKSAEEYVHKGLEVIEKWKDHDLVKIIFAPHAPYTVDDPTFELMKEVSKSHHQRIHIHLHETNQEVVDHLANHKIRPIQRMHDLGLMNENLIAVHMTQLTDEEIALVAKTKVHVVNCPESNLKLGSGMCPVNKLHNAGANVCLGTDGPASNDDLDLLGEMRTSALLDKYSHNGTAKTLTVWQMLAMATINGAKALGLDDRIGSLEIGKDADFLAIRLTSHPVYDPLKTLVYCGTNKVEYVWVAGKSLVEESVLKTVDVKEAKKRSDEWREKLLSWDQQRKKVDAKRIRETMKEAEAGNKEAKDLLQQDKDNLSHLIYFASMHHYDTGLVLDELNKLAKDVEEVLK